MALNYLLNFAFTIFHALFCVDSKSVLYDERHLSMKVRGDIMAEISQIIHILILQGKPLTSVGYHCIV